MEFYGGIWEVHAASPYLNDVRLAPNQFFHNLHYRLASVRPAGVRCTTHAGGTGEPVPPIFSPMNMAYGNLMC
jgi:hypothetical protein